jgi:hypothetical protein
VLLSRPFPILVLLEVGSRADSERQADVHGRATRRLEAAERFAQMVGEAMLDVSFRPGKRAT